MKKSDKKKEEKKSEDEEELEEVEEVKEEILKEKDLVGKVHKRKINKIENLVLEKDWNKAVLPSKDFTPSLERDQGVSKNLEVTTSFEKEKKQNNIFEEDEMKYLSEKKSDDSVKYSNSNMEKISLAVSRVDPFDSNKSFSRGNKIDFSKASYSEEFGKSKGIEQYTLPERLDERDFNKKEISKKEIKYRPSRA